MRKLIITLILFPIFSYGQRYSSYLSIDIGATATNFVSDYYKQNNANPNTVWKPSYGLSFGAKNKTRQDIYSSLGFQITSFAQQFKSQLDPAYSNYVMYQTQSNSEIQYLQIPIIIGYSFANTKLNPYIGIGYSTAFLLNYNQKNNTGFGVGSEITEEINKKGITTYSEFDNSIEFKQQPDKHLLYQKTNSFVIAEMGINYSVGSRTSIKAGLQYSKSLDYIEDKDYFYRGYQSYVSFYISRTGNLNEMELFSLDGTKTRIEKTNPFQTKLSSFGFQFAIQYSLKK